MARTLKVAVVVALLIAFPMGCSEHQPPPTPPPHLLLISLDALRADHLSSHGYHRHTTPFLDDSLRELFGRLDEIGFLDNAVVLITADHGEEFGDHGGLLHRGSLFDELVRVPFIVWGRGVESGVVDPTLVSTIDIPPTLLAAAGIGPSPTMEGRDVLAPSPVAWADQRVFAQYRDVLYSIRTPRFKLIRGPGRRLRLFDLENDSNERRNLARDRPELAVELDTELEFWRLARPRIGGDGASTTELDPATEERLRTLGYID